MKMEAETEKVKDEKDKTEKELSDLMQYVNTLKSNEEELKVPKFKDDNLINDAWKAIQKELDKPIPTLKQKWRQERKEAVRQILREMQTRLFEAKTAQKDDILRLGKALYQKAMNMPFMAQWG